MALFSNFPYHADQIYTFIARRMLGYLALAMGLTISTANHGFTQTEDAARRTTLNARPDADSAVIFMYHRFGEDDIPATNTPVEQFKSHLRVIEEGKHPVIPLPEMLDHYEKGTPLPDRAVILTVDDSYRSVYETAWPLLKQAGHAFTLFVATDHVDRASKATKPTNYMTWDMVRDLYENGVTIANHTSSHLHMPAASAEKNRTEILSSQQRFQDELGFQPDIFAYPYGEYSLEVQNIVQNLGFRAAFGQHSGVSYAGGDRFALPRFALNEKHGDQKSFALRANALALPISDMIPLEPLVTAEMNPPAIGFTVGDRVKDPRRLSCYRTKRLDIRWLGERRAEIRMEDALRRGRTRINCTILSASGRWRWFSAMFIVPR